MRADWEVFWTPSKIPKPSTKLKQAFTEHKRVSGKGTIRLELIIVPLGKQHDRNPSTAAKILSTNTFTSTQTRTSGDGSTGYSSSHLPMRHNR